MTISLSVCDVIETGDWATDCAHGREVAKAKIAEARLDRNPCGINAIFRSIVESGRYGGIEVGFVAELACEIISAPL